VDSGLSLSAVTTAADTAALTATEGNTAVALPYTMARGQKWTHDMNMSNAIFHNPTHSVLSGLSFIAVASLRVLGM